MRPSRTTTAPTMGLGSTVPCPRAARAKAKSMHQASSPAGLPGDGRWSFGQCSTVAHAYGVAEKKRPRWLPWAIPGVSCCSKPPTAGTPRDARVQQELHGSRNLLPSGLYRRLRIRTGSCRRGGSWARPAAPRPPASPPVGNCPKGGSPCPEGCLIIYVRAFSITCPPRPIKRRPGPGGGAGCGPRERNRGPPLRRSGTMEITRDFAVATFVVHQGRVLLLYHKRLGMWLPPGGHIEPNELPDEAAVREVY